MAGLETNMLRNFNMDQSESTFNSACTLFVGDLSFFCSEDDLIKIFAKFGPISKVCVRRGVTGESLMHGFAALQSAESARWAIAELDGREFMGRHIRVQLSSDDQRPDPERHDKFIQLHVSFISRQIAVTVTEKLLREVFASYGEIADVVVKKHTTAQMRQTGYGFVYFYDVNSAYRAVQALKHSTVGDVTFDCSVSHKSEQKIKKQLGSVQDSSRVISLNSASDLAAYVQQHRKPILPPTPPTVPVYGNAMTATAPYMQGIANSINDQQYMHAQRSQIAEQSNIPYQPVQTMHKTYSLPWQPTVPREPMLPRANSGYTYPSVYSTSPAPNTPHRPSLGGQSFYSPNSIPTASMGGQLTRRPSDLYRTPSSDRNPAPFLGQYGGRMSAQPSQVSLDTARGNLASDSQQYYFQWPSVSVDDYGEGTPNSSFYFPSPVRPSPAQLPDVGEGTSMGASASVFDLSTIGSSLQVAKWTKSPFEFGDAEEISVTTGKFTPLLEHCDSSSSVSTVLDGLPGLNRSYGKFEPAGSALASSKPSDLADRLSEK